MVTRIERTAALAVVFLLVALIWAQAPAEAQERGRCASVDVGWTFSLPDGSTHPPGELTLCLDTRYSPIAGLHSVRVNGKVHGLLLSNAKRSEAAADAPPIVVFRKDTAGRLLLYGYTWNGKQPESYLLDGFGDSRTEVDEPIVLVARAR